MSGLHSFLCSAPLLRELKARSVICNSRCLDPFPLRLQAEPRERSSENDSVSTEEPLRIWACRDLKVLSMKFKLSTSYGGPANVIARDARVVFGYLIRVYPKLEDIDIRFDRVLLDLQVGLCLVSRLKHLEKLQIGLPSQRYWWNRLSQDLSWTDPLPLSRLSWLYQRLQMKTWYPQLWCEYELIRQRQEHLDRCGESCHALWADKGPQ